MWTDHLCSGQQPVSLPGWIENSLFGSHQHGTGPSAFDMAADDLHSHRVQDLDLIFIDANHHLAIQWRWSCPIVRLVHLNGAIVIDRARLLLKISEWDQGQGLQIGFFFRKHLDHLTLAPAVDPLGRPALFPVYEPIVLGLDTVEPTSLLSRPTLN